MTTMDHAAATAALATIDTATEALKAAHDALWNLGGIPVGDRAIVGATAPQALYEIRNALVAAMAPAEVTL